MENIDVSAINKLISGKSSINVGIELKSAMLLAAAVFLAVVLGCVVAKLITNNL